MRGLSLVAASGGHSSSRCAGLSLSRSLLLWSTGSRRAGSVIVAHGPSHSAACGIFPDQGSNPCPLHWQADSQPLRHQGSPRRILNHCATKEVPEMYIFVQSHLKLLKLFYSYIRRSFYSLVSLSDFFPVLEIFQYHFFFLFFKTF